MSIWYKKDARRGVLFLSLSGVEVYPCVMRIIQVSGQTDKLEFAFIVLQ